MQVRLGCSAAADSMEIHAHALDRGQQTATDTMQALLTTKPGAKSREDTSAG